MFACACAVAYVVVYVVVYVVPRSKDKDKDKSNDSSPLASPTRPSSLTPRRFTFRPDISTPKELQSATKAQAPSRTQALSQAQLSAQLSVSKPPPPYLTGFRRASSEDALAETPHGATVAASIVANSAQRSSATVSRAHAKFALLRADANAASLASPMSIDADGWDDGDLFAAAAKYDGDGGVEVRGTHSRTYTIPYPTIPYPTLPYPTIPYPTLPYPTLPYHTLPYHTTPYPTLPYPTLPHHTLPYPTIPYHTIPYHTIPYHTMVVATVDTTACGLCFVHHTIPYHAIPYIPYHTVDVLPSMQPVGNV